MENWYKIDLHQHTLNEITHDGKVPQSLYTHAKFEQVLLEEKVNLKAVTNHNTLNLIDHIKHALICKKNDITYLPGVEIDYLFNGHDVHGITILNPNMDLVPFSLKLREIINQKKNKIYLDKDEFANIHESIEFIFIPHIMKAKGIYPSQLVPKIEEAEDWVMNMIRHGTFVPVIFENTQNYNKYSIYGKVDQLLGKNSEYPACYVGSDYKFDNDKKRRKTAIERVKYYINAMPTYRGLEISIRNHKTRLAHESELINRTNYIKSITFNENRNFENDIKLNFSPSLNVIIGGSGSGKTLLLNEIFRMFTNQDLKDVENASNKKKKARAYSSKIGKSPLFNIETTPNDFSKFKVIEIPNIYTEIMKYVNDHKQLATVFNISDRSYVNGLITSFKSNCLNFKSLIDDISDAEKIGEENLRNIITSIEFFRMNPIEKNTYDLKIMTMINLLSDKTRTIINHDVALTSKKDEIIEYFKSIDVALDKEFTEIIKRIISNYCLLLTKLDEKIDMLEKRELDHKITEQIQNIINMAIRMSNNKLGLKEKAFKEREETKSNNTQELIANIKKTLISKNKINNIVLCYPYAAIKRTIEENNANELARFTLAFNEKDLKSVSVDDEEFIETQNNKGKLKNLSNKTIDFTNDNSLKDFIKSLRDNDLNLNDLIKNEPNLKLELNVNGEWKSATEVNQGTIAKVSMEYYFNGIINSERPDIIFIDQPENDVDKEFLTQTLADFLKNKKSTAQIFITTHDAILTINADANMIVQSDVDENNKFNYISYPIEYSDSNVNKSDEVARILDGGKRNIEKRYQIYGGILKYGNQN